MDLVYSVAILGLAVNLFVLFLIGERMPNRPGWASNWLASDLSTVAITGLIAFAISFGVRFAMTVNEQAIGLKVAALLAATLAAHYFILRQLAPRRWLAEYAAERARGSNMNELPMANVVSIVAPAGNDGPSGEPTLPRAA